MFIITELRKKSNGEIKYAGHYKDAEDAEDAEDADIFTVIPTEGWIILGYLDDIHASDKTIDIMFVRHGESDSNRGKALLHSKAGGIMQPALVKQLEANMTGFKPSFLTKRARLQAFNHGFQVIPEYLLKKKNDGKYIKVIKMYCSVLPRAMETAKLSAYGFECAKIHSDYSSELRDIVLETIIKPILDVSEIPPTGKVTPLGSVTMPVVDYLSTVSIVNLMNPDNAPVTTRSEFFTPMKYMKHHYQVVLAMMMKY